MSWLFQQLFSFFNRFILFTITHSCYPLSLKLQRTQPSFAFILRNFSGGGWASEDKKTPQSLAGSVFQPIRCVNY